MRKINTERKTICACYNNGMYICNEYHIIDVKQCYVYNVFVYFMLCYLVWSTSFSFLEQTCVLLFLYNIQLECNVFHKL